MLKGIDVSDAQGSIDWGKVKDDGISFVFLKATEGADFVSKTFTEERVDAIRKAGLLWGPYHYLRPRRDRNGVVESRHFYRTVVDRGWRHGHDLPLVVDIEWISNRVEVAAMTGAQLREYSSEFCEDVYQRNGTKLRRGCMTYLSPAFAPELGNRPPRRGGVSFVAAWDAPDGKPPTPSGFQRSKVLFHQISDRARVAGVPTAVDLNLFLGSRADLKALIGGDVKKPKPVPGLSKRDKLTVREQQKLLKKIGWPLEVDGVRGPATKGALMDFQLGMAKSGQRLTRDGVCGPLTTKWLRWSAAHDGHASDHFRYREFASSHAPHWIKVDRDLILALEKLRAKLGRSIGVLSGYRDFALGASKSQHRYGNAMDPTASLGSVSFVRGLGFSGIGFDPRDGHVRHVDVRHRGPNFTGGTPSHPTVFADSF